MTWTTTEEDERLLELGFDPYQEKPPTEEQVRELQGAAEVLESTFDDGWTDIIEDNKWKPVVTDDFKDTVIKAKLFIVLVEDYIDRRGNIESDWSSVPSPTAAESFDMSGDYLSIQWR